MLDMKKIYFSVRIVCDCVCVWMCMIVLGKECASIPRMNTISLLFDIMWIRPYWFLRWICVWFSSEFLPRRKYHRQGRLLQFCKLICHGIIKGNDKLIFSRTLKIIELGKKQHMIRKSKAINLAIGHWKENLKDKT